MKRWSYTFLFVFIYLVSCKTDKVNGNSIIEFQESLNKLSGGIKTIKQVKLREALYIIKQFGTEESEDLEKMDAVAKMLHGKKLAEVFSFADSIASIHGIDWLSDAPPSLGDMGEILDSYLPIDSANAISEDDLVLLDEIHSPIIYHDLDKPEIFVSKFLQNISEKKLLEAYKMSDNPDWNSFAVFSNTISGFGAVEHVDIENIVVDSEMVDEANVSAKYIVIDNANKKIRLNVGFSLRIYARNWKIVNYKVNSTQRL